MKCFYLLVSLCLPSYREDLKLWGGCDLECVNIIIRLNKTWLSIPNVERETFRLMILYFSLKNENTGKWNDATILSVHQNTCAYLLLCDCPVSLIIHYIYVCLSCNSWFHQNGSSFRNIKSSGYFRVWKSCKSLLSYICTGEVIEKNCQNFLLT
jgi:hypothetical protein